MKRGFAIILGILAGIMLLLALAGQLVLQLTEAEMAYADRINQELLSQFTTVDSAVPLPENEGKPVRVCGKVEIVSFESDELVDKLLGVRVMGLNLLREVEDRSGENCNAVLPGAGLGVKGAAYATLIARSVELVLTFIGLKLTGSVLVGGLKDMFSYEKAVLSQFAKTAVPVILNETVWGVGISMYSVVYGRMGDSAAAVMTIVGTYTDIEVVGMQGLSTATAVLLGKEMGAGKLDDAKRHAAYDLFLALLIGLALTLLTLFVRKPYISLYAVTPESAVSIYQCLLVFAMVMHPL